MVASISRVNGRAFLLFHFLGSLTLIALFFSTGSTASPVKEKSSNFCSPVTPCGWLVYLPETKLPDYYVRSPCSCPKDAICVRDSEDIAISSYIYRCRNAADAKGLDVLKEELDGEASSTNLVISGGVNRVMNAGGRMHP